MTEVSLLRDLRHPHIVRYFDRIVCKETKQLYILIEYCPGGDLATVIKTCIRYVMKSSSCFMFVLPTVYNEAGGVRGREAPVSSSFLLQK